MIDTSSYLEMQRLARTVRADHGLTTPRVTETDLQRIYQHHGIRIDWWRFPGVLGAYADGPDGPSVAINAKLPRDPRVFTLAHELKHHLVDASSRFSVCGSPTSDWATERAAEMFAAELLFPLDLFVTEMGDLGCGFGECTAEHLVALKRGTGTTMSYRALSIHAEKSGFARRDSFRGVRWRDVVRGMYGEPSGGAARRGRRSRGRHP